VQERTWARRADVKVGQDTISAAAVSDALSNWYEGRVDLSTSFQTKNPAVREEGRGDRFRRENSAALSHTSFVQLHT
jgi:hypothetical protein